MSAFALLISPANFSIHLRQLTERSPTVQRTEDRRQMTELLYLPQVLCKRFNIFATRLYSLLKYFQESSLIYPKSKQYLTHTRISSDEPIAISKNRLNSFDDWFCLPNPSAIFAQIDLLARLIWSARLYYSSLGKVKLSLCISNDNL